MSSGKFVNSLKRDLSRLGIYDCEAPGIAAELGAYEAGIAPIEEQMETVFGNHFVLTADGDSLMEKESLIRKCGQLTDEERRQFLLNYGNRANFDAGAEAQLLAMAGIVGELSERWEDDPYSLAVTVTELKGTSLEAAVERLRELLPLHLELAEA